MRYLWFSCVIYLLLGSKIWAAPFSIDAFAYDRVLFDVGAAFGRDQANIPVAGDAQPGASVEVRSVNARTGATGQWRSAQVADAAGRWRAVMPLAAQPDWYRIEARAGSTHVTMQTRFGTGDVVGILGQSELERLWSQYHSKRTEVSLPLRTTDQVQFTLQNKRGKISHMFAEAKNTHAMQALAGVWIDNAPPGRKLHIVDLTQSGTARSHLQNDADPKRHWSDLVAVVEAAGAPIGLVLESWFAGDRGTGLKWAERFMPLYTGTTLQGRDFRRGTTDITGVPVDHFLWDVSSGQEGLFEVGQTALGIFGPHRFDSDEPLLGATLRTNGKPEYGMRSIERARKGVAAFIADKRMRGIIMQPALPHPMDYANGHVDPQKGRLVDAAHPSDRTADGSPRLAKHVANAALFALGHLRYRLPQIDKVTWQDNMVELSSSVGPITTARHARGTSSAPRAAVAGFEVNGRAVLRAELTSQGRVRLFPNKGRKFRAGDVIAFGMGGAGGMMNPVADWRAGAYLTYPLVDVGVTGLEGVALKPGVEFVLQP